MYSLVKPLLFALDAESAHNFTLQSLGFLHKIRLLPRRKNNVPHAATTVMGITFPNPVGLAAGLDKNGDYIDALATLGFGFLEIGTVTPRPQPGNPRPRLFRLEQANAIINRMGFNNKGIDALVENVERAKFRGILGINIGKNFDTPNHRAVEDYLLCMKKAFVHASYIAVNISSPNTAGLRDLQNVAELDELLGALKNEQQTLTAQHGKYVPLAVKIAPDLANEQITAMANAFLKHRIDAVIATNTTVSRAGVEHFARSRETGGLSGAPLFATATHVLAAFKKALGDTIPIIGVGGICSADQAGEKFRAGAQLVQFYTGLIYRGPRLIGEIVNRQINLKRST